MDSKRLHVIRRNRYALPADQRIVGYESGAIALPSDCIEQPERLYKKVDQRFGRNRFFAPIDLFIDDKNVFQPALAYIPKNNLNMISGRGIEGVPDLVVEIISPSNIFTDRNTKKNIYRKIGVKEYWIVAPQTKRLKFTSTASLIPMYLTLPGRRRHGNVYGTARP